MKKHRMTTKALSVLLTVIMLFTTISVGLIVPEADLTASAATVTVNSWDELRNAINTANGASEKTTIKIGTALSHTGSSIAALPAISGDVVLDLSGNSITVTYTVSADYGSGQNMVQIPSENTTLSHTSMELLPKSLITVSGDGSLQIINTGMDNGCAIQTKAYFEDTQKTESISHQASAGVIESAGTLILGDKDNSAYNKFKIVTHASVRNSNNDSSGGNKSGTAKAMGITINGSKAVFKMYGGTIQGSGYVRARRNAQANMRIYPLNINSCYSAEIYGGEINIPNNANEDKNGISNPRYDALDGANVIISAIRTNTSNVYIFNVKSSVYAYAGTDTGNGNTVHLSNIYCDGSSTPALYGGNFSYSGTTDDGNSTATVNAVIVRNSAAISNGTSLAKVIDASKNINPQSVGTRGGTITSNFVCQSIFAHDGGSAFNGLDMFSYPTFADYKTAAEGADAETDACGVAVSNLSTETHFDTSSYSCDTKNYKRNAYTHTGWIGKTTPGGALSYKNTSEAGVAANGGSLFLEPTWTATLYDITYSFGDSEQYPVNNKSIFTDSNKKYNITSTDAIPVPVRLGWIFEGWDVNPTVHSETDDSTNWSKGNYGGADKPLSVTGKYGDIHLTAIWTPVKYKIDIDENADDIGDSTSSYAAGEINGAAIPYNLEKDYYTFDGYYKVEKVDSNSNWNSGDIIYASSDPTEVNKQFAGKYGNITLLQAHFTPIEYTISFDMDDDEVDRDDRPSEDDKDYFYNIKTDERNLPILTPPGRHFNGWKVVSSEGNWVVGETYHQITSGMHGNVKFKADYDDKKYKIEIVLEDDEFFNISPLGYGYTFRDGGTIDGVASKNGWDFVGWQVIDAWSHLEGDVVTWEINGDPIVYDAETGLTSFDAGKVGNIKVKPHFVEKEYEITFNSNGGTEADTIKYTIGATRTIPSTSKNGWTFGGWRVSETAGTWQKGSIYSAGSTVLSGLWGNVTLEAVWTETPYTVTLDLNGGEGVTNKSLGYITNASTYLRETPVKTGYTFKGWEIIVFEGSWGEFKTGLEEKNALVTDALPAGYYGNVTLRAVWEATVYDIQFIGFPESSIRYTYVDTIVLPSASSPGQDFVGWQLGDNIGNWSLSQSYKAGNTYTGMYGNVVFTPVFIAKTYKINFVDSDGVTAIGSPLPYEFAESFTLGSHSKPGYTFLGWQVMTVANPADSGGWTKGDEFPAGDFDAGRFYGDVTLKAVYEINKYNITFITDGGVPIADRLYTTESTEPLPRPEKTGYEFVGWKVTTADGNWILNEFVIDGIPPEGRYGNVTLTAQWLAKKYTISWVVDGKTTTTEVSYGDTPSFDGTPEKAQDAENTYEFAGWSPAIKPVTGDATYEAKFKGTLRSYNVTWKYLASYEDTEETVDKETYKYGEHPVFSGDIPVKVSTEENKIYRFAGWSDGTTNLTNETKVTGDVVYTPLFTEIDITDEDVITITWKVEGASYETYWLVGETPSYPGTNKLADMDGYTREISGWNPAIEKVTADATYTAGISSFPKDYQASFDLNGGEYDGETVVTYNRNRNAPLYMPQPEKAGYTFKGWKVTKTESEKWKLNEIYTASSYAEHWGEVSFVAVWEATEYTLTVRTDSGETKTVYTIESTDALSKLEKTGYEFVGWLVLTADAGSNWMPGATVVTDKSLLGMYGNVTIEPVWSAKTYKIYWVSGAITQTVEVRYGEYIVSYAPVSKAGYTAEWEDEIPATMPAHDVTINAVYTTIRYFISFNTNGADAIDGFDYNIESGKKLPEPEREGATFKGWKVSAGGGSWVKDDVYDGGTALLGTYGNVTLTAVWNFNVYEITWRIEGSADRVTKWYYGAEPAYDGTPYRAPDDENSYEFTGKWRTADGKEITKIPVVTGDATYEAIFSESVRTYTVKWDVDGKITERKYTYGQVVECPFTSDKPPVRPSTNEYEFTFLGWSPEIKPGETIVTGDVTYTAVFDVYTKIQGLRIDQTAIFLDINDSANLTAVISPSTATNKDVEWVSLNQNIATVNENGKIVGVSAGETLIRVQSKDGKFKAFCLVSVAPVTTDYIVVSAAGVSTTRLPGEAVQLYATIMPENASNKIIKWTTSNPAVATVDANGLVVFGSTTGTAVITATSDGYASGSITVTSTTDESLIKDDVKTYVVMFYKSSSTYIIAGQTYESINVICKEGDTLEFLLTEPHFVTLNATQFERDTDGVYRIKNINKNYSVIASERPDLGFEPEPEEPDNNGAVKLSFFERLKDFFRSIVEFFRNLFN